MQSKFSALLLAAGSIAYASDYPISLDHNNLRLTYENVKLPGDEDMGLVGLNYQMQLGEYGYGGLGVYGAATGERGGFFVGGFEGGLRYPLSERIEAEAGLFVGGGGGGAAPQGGGLMLRPHVGLSYEIENIHAGVQLSRIEFPNGDISSTQIVGVIDIPFESFRLDGDYAGDLRNVGQEIGSSLHRSLDGKVARLGIEVQHYEPAGDVRATDGAEQKSFETVGVRYEQAFDEHFSWHITTAGAMGGESDGYAEVYAGTGWRQHILDTPFYLTAEGSVGLAGGGRVYTGGGSMIRAKAGIEWMIAPAWSIEAQGGIVDSIDGDFKASTLEVALEHSFGILVPSQQPDLFTGAISRSDWRLQTVYENYFDAARKSHNDASAGLIGLQAQSLQDGWYLYARAMGAVSGDAGGYVSGSLGAGAEYPLSDTIALYAQAGLGAAGGGGIDVGDGAIAEAEAGIRFGVTKNIDLTLSGGAIRSLNGGLESPTISAGVEYKFGTLNW
ncbi:MAG: hypothetical protein PHE73_06875 [Sulfurovaceae bacterium]|nr:hypothetical protein [Sulfurovaceae bacterium]